MDVVWNLLGKMDSGLVKGMFDMLLHVMLTKTGWSRMGRVVFNPLIIID